MRKESNYAELDEENDELFLMALVVEHEEKQSDAWFIHSKYSNHMCSDKGMFIDMIDGDNHFVKWRNNFRMEVVRNENVKMVLGGVDFLVKEVYYVREVINNLLLIMD